MLLFKLSFLILCCHVFWYLSPLRLHVFFLPHKPKFVFFFLIITSVTVVFFRLIMLHIMFRKDKNIPLKPLVCNFHTAAEWMLSQEQKQEHLCLFKWSWTVSLLSYISPNLFCKQRTLRNTSFSCFTTRCNHLVGWLHLVPTIWDHD